MGEYYFIIVTAIIICFFIAEFFGRSKHIGRWWSFFLLLGGLIPGIIAIIVSPSARKQPTRGGKIYNIWCWISLAFGVLNLIQLYNTEGQQGQLFFCFFILSFYLFELSKGEVINKNPKYYFQISNPISSNGKDVEKKEKPKKDLKGIIENLKELREDGLLTDLEYETKLNNVINEQNKDSVSESEEFLKLKKLFNAGILDNTEFEEKTKILIERQSINIKKGSKNADLEIASQPISPIKEFQSEKAIPPKQDNSWRNFIIFIAIFIGLIIFIGNSGVLKKTETQEESYPNMDSVIADTSAVTEPISSINTESPEPSSTISKLDSLAIVQEGSDVSPQITQTYFIGEWEDGNSNFKFYSNGDFYLKIKGGSETWTRWAYINNELFIGSGINKIKFDLEYIDEDSFSINKNESTWYLATRIAH